MADLIQVLTDEDIVPKRFTGTFTGPLTRAKILTALGPAAPLARNTTFVVENATKAWFVLYDKAADQYWYEELTKAA